HEKNLPAVIASMTAAPKPPPPLAEQLFSLAATLKDGQELSSLLEKTIHPQDGRFAAWQLAAVFGIFETRAKRATSLESLIKENAVITAALGYARQKSADETASEADRLAAVALLGFEPSNITGDLVLFRRLLDARTSPSLQSAAVKTLGRIKDE